MMLLLLLQQFRHLLKINIACHCGTFLSFLPLLQSLFLILIIKLKHHNCSSSCPRLYMFLLFRRDVCRVQRPFVINEPLS